MSQVQQKEKLHTVVVKEFTNTFRGHKRTSPGKPGRRRKQFHVTITNTLPESDDRVQKVLAERQREAEVRRTKAKLQRNVQRAERSLGEALEGIFNESVSRILGPKVAAQFEESKKRRRRA